MNNELKKIYIVGANNTHDYAQYRDKGYFGAFVQVDDELKPQIIDDATLTKMLFDEQTPSYAGYQTLSKEYIVHLEKENQAAFDYLQEQFPTVDIRLNFDNLRRQLSSLREAELIDNNSFGEATIPLAANLENNELEDDDIDYYADIENESEVEKNKGKRAAVIGASLVGVAVGAGLHHFLTPYIHKSDTNIKQDNTQSVMDDLGLTVNMNNISVTQAIEKISNPEQKQFATEIYNTFHKTYQVTHKENNFRMDEADKDAYLTFMPEELEAIALTLNDYSKIHGDKYPDFIAGFNQTETEMKANFLSGWQKLSLYYMNAVEPSGIADLIHDAENKAFFQEMENRVIAFNANPTVENATEVWRNVYYNYIIAGSTGNYQNSNGQESVRANVATLAYAGPHGISMSHRNLPEMFTVKLDDAAEKARANVGEAFLQSGTQFLPLLDNLQNEMQTVIENEDTNKNYNPMDFGNISINEGVNQRGLCADVFAHIRNVTRDMSEYRNNNAVALNQTKSNAKAILIDSLRQKGELGLAAEVNDAKVVDDALLSKISTSREARESVDQYKASMAKHEQTSISYKDVAGRMTDEAYSYLVNKPASAITKEDKIQLSEAEAIVIMTNNRFKNVEKDLDLSSSYNNVQESVVTPGVTSSVTETVQVEKEDLPAELQAEATKQENKIVAEIAKDNTPGAAQEDAVDYANSTRYDDNGKLDPYIPNSNLNYYSTQRYLAAYTNEKINVTSDAQIQAAVNQDLNSYINSLSAKEQAGLQALYGDAWKTMISETYKTNWINELSAITNNAYNDGLVHGEELRKQNDALRDAAQKEVDKLNEQNQIPTEETKTDTAPTQDAEAPKEVPKETNTNEEVTPPANNTQPPVKEEEVEVPEVKDPNIGEQIEEGEVIIEDNVVVPPVIEKPIDQTPPPATDEVEVPKVDVPGQDTGETKEQGGAEITDEDQAIIDAMNKAQQEQAEPTTEINNPVMETPSNNGWVELNPDTLKEATQQQQAAPQVPEVVENAELTEIESYLSDEVEVEPVKTR